MSTSNLSTSKKVGIGFYGLLAGISTVVVFTAASFFLGVAASYFLRYTRWDPAGELSAWFGLAWAWYAFWPGVVLGLVVWWKVFSSRVSVPKVLRSNGKIDLVVFTVLVGSILVAVCWFMLRPGRHFDPSLCKKLGNACSCPRTHGRRPRQ